LPGQRYGLRVSDPHHLRWPPTRLDLFGLASLGVLVYAAFERQWTVVGVALFALLIAGVLPMMRGPFEVGGPVKLKGELVDPPARGGALELPSRQPSETDRPDALPPQGPPGTTEFPRR